MYKFRNNKFVNNISNNSKFNYKTLMLVYDKYV